MIERIKKRKPEKNIFAVSIYRIYWLVMYNVSESGFGQSTGEDKS